MPLMQQLVLQLTGVSLDESKSYLIESRLGPVAERAGCSSFRDLHLRVRQGQDEGLLHALIDAITTHETVFFRDGAPFEALQKKMLPDAIAARLRAGRERRLRIWSAACSTGQEPYSIAIMVHEAMRELSGWEVQIVATDIAKPTLEAAERGVYAAREMERSRRPDLMKKYFTTVDNGGGRVVDAVRKMVRWQELNLLDAFTKLGQFDIVFLRNVMIYFEVETRRALARRALQTLLPHGWLVVGATENLLEVGAGLLPQTICGTTIYQRPPVPAGTC